MLVTRKSTLTGKENTMELNVTQKQLDLYDNGGGLVQTIFKNLTNGEREFIKSGITPEEWVEMFGGNN